MKYMFYALIVLIVFSCKNEENLKSLSALEIINKSIEVSGGKRFENSLIKFIFRDRSYVAKRLKGETSMVRMFIDSNDTITDFLSNSEYKRMIGDSYVKVSDSMAKLYSASVNSVHYFSVLPYGLNDAAVNKSLLGKERIGAKYYYKIKVTFDKEGGGEDFEDVFIYWVDSHSFKTVYIAYSYNENNGVGMRFREAFNERYINGIRFVDYNNYKSEDNLVKLIDLANAYEQNQLKLLSKVELESINVELIDH